MHGRCLYGPAWNEQGDKARLVSAAPLLYVSERQSVRFFCSHTMAPFSPGLWMTQTQWIVCTNLAEVCKAFRQSSSLSGFTERLLLQTSLYIKGKSRMIKQTKQEFQHCTYRRSAECNRSTYNRPDYHTPYVLFEHGCRDLSSFIQKSISKIREMLGCCGDSSSSSSQRCSESGHCAGHSSSSAWHTMVSWIFLVHRNIVMLKHNRVRQFQKKKRGNLNATHAKDIL